MRFQEALFRPRPQLTEDDVRETESLDGDELQPYEDEAEKNKVVLEKGSEQAMEDSSRRRRFWDSLTTRFKTVRDRHVSLRWK